MPRFLIEMPHTPEECRLAADEWLTLDNPRKQELFDATVFGCDHGVHEAWLVAEFEDEDDAWRSVVEVQRPTARVMQVSSYSFDEMLAAHQQAREPTPTTG